MPTTDDGAELMMILNSLTKSKIIKVEWYRMELLC